MLLINPAMLLKLLIVMDAGRSKLSIDLSESEWKAMEEQNLVLMQGRGKGPSRL